MLQLRYKIGLDTSIKVSPRFHKVIEIFFGDVGLDCYFHRLGFCELCLHQDSFEQWLPPLSTNLSIFCLFFDNSLNLLILALPRLSLNLHLFCLVNDVNLRRRILLSLQEHVNLNILVDVVWWIKLSLHIYLVNLNLSKILICIRLYLRLLICEFHQDHLGCTVVLLNLLHGGLSIY